MKIEIPIIIFCVFVITDIGHYFLESLGMWRYVIEITLMAIIVFILNKTKLLEIKLPGLIVFMIFFPLFLVYMFVEINIIESINR